MDLLPATPTYKALGRIHCVAAWGTAVAPARHLTAHGAQGYMMDLQGTLESFAREPGRSTYADLRIGDDRMSAGVHDEVVHPAASLLKLPLATAVEPLLSGMPAQRVGDLLPDGASVLQFLDSDHLFAPSELLRLMVSLSDNTAARWALEAIGIERVREQIRRAGATATTAEVDDDGSLVGVTTARDAVALLSQALDDTTVPLTSHALRHSLRNSRIPLGANSEDVKIAHKTGTLRGVAHDVALISTDGGELLIAFLCSGQHDTLVTGYEMGICTRKILEDAGLSTQRTSSALL